MKDLYVSARKARSLAPQMSIVYREIDQLKPDPANPRRHSEKRIHNTIKTLSALMPGSGAIATAMLLPVVVGSPSARRA
jgi:hypothetical protein